ncbi:MAG: methionyl-tRNA formyltransferase [Defluviitaleaceae bacterium]|nr:methionyl-tRNA formyltransferase [Defluviitaleaceae bacterium]
MKIVFMGTPEFAVPPLQQLLARHNVLAVLTQPDRPAGRGHKMQISPVKALAVQAGVEVLQPETLSIKRSTYAKEIREYLIKMDVDVFVVAAYGLILPKAVLDIPRHGCINIHASLLPKYRGAAPIHMAIKEGEATTGITIMQMDTGIDTGDMILQRQLDISPHERTPSLHDRMAALGGECIIDALAMIEAGTAIYTPQDDTLSSYAPMIKKTDGMIDWAWPTNKIINITRAFDPWPGPYTLYNGTTIKIWQVDAASDTKDAPAGTILVADAAKGLLVSTGDGSVWVRELQATGGKRMQATDYLRGRSIGVGECFGSA